MKNTSMKNLNSAIQKWGNFWDVLVDLPEADREQMYLTMASEINACSDRLKVVRRQMEA